MNGKKHEALSRCFWGCNEREGTIARASNHYGDTTVCLRPPWMLKPLGLSLHTISKSGPGAPNHCEECRKVPTMSQVLSSIQYICFRKTVGSNMESPNLLLASGAIWPRNALGALACINKLMALTLRFSQTLPSVDLDIVTTTVEIEKELVHGVLALKSWLVTNSQSINI